MKRKLFFLFDKLKITRNERLAISMLMVILTSLLLANALISSSSPFDEEYYQELDNQFKKRTAVLRHKEQTVLARYYGNDSLHEMALGASLRDTLPALPSDAVNGVNINEVGLKKLQSLPGVGPAYARRIINYRNEHGSFRTSTDLLNIKGIGRATLNKMMPYIYIKGKPDKSGSEEISHPKASKIDKTGKRKIVPGNPLTNINTANIQELQKLPGIGPAYSQRIITYRQKHGGFKTFSDLLNIKGIGRATLSKIKPFILLGSDGTKSDSAAVRQQQQSRKGAKEATDKQTGANHSLININTADAQELQTIPGIGPAYSQRIIKYRQENGSFKTKNSLLKIKGIGKKTLAKIKPFIKLKE